MAPFLDGTDFKGIAVTTSSFGTELAISFQSDREIVLDELRQAIPLVCVSTHHATSHYTWKQLGIPGDFPSSPVIYVKDVGLYLCQVTSQGVSVDSSVISVQVKPGRDVPSLICREDVHGIVIGSSASSTNPADEQTEPKECSSPVLKFSMTEIEQATGNFSDDRVLGYGGFGKVYWGLLRGTKVAVKRLNQKGAGQIKPEIDALTRFRHKNLVDLMGYVPSPHTIIYEFLEEGSLHDHLHDQEMKPLTWNDKARILKDTVRGLTWLHMSSPPLIHQDIKSANILLDKHLSAKLGDFGFSYEIPESKLGRTHVTALAFARTEGYYPPELVHGELSPKTDVYSYGVVVLEAFTGLQAYVKELTEERKDRKLTDHVDVSTVAELGSFQDPRSGDLPPYLLQLFFKVISTSMVKMSKRSTSTEVLRLWNETNF